MLYLRLNLLSIPVVHFHQIVKPIADKNVIHNAKIVPKEYTHIV